MDGETVLAGSKSLGDTNSYRGFFALSLLLFLSACYELDNNSAVQRPPRAIFLKEFRVVPMTPDGPMVLDEASVLIVEGVIKAVGPTGSIQVPGDALEIRGDGRTLMPGLIDMHVHVWDEAELPVYLASGVTTVRNVAGMPFHLDFSRRIASGALFGPRIETTGPILNSPGPNAQINHQLVENVAEARQAVKDQYEQGYRRLKVYSNLTREAYDAIRAEARLLGMSIMGHTPEGFREPGIPHTKPFKIAFLDVIDDGFVTIEHMESIVWHGLADSLNPADARNLARQIANAGVAVVPTLVAHRNLLEVAKSQGEFLKRDGVETLNPFITEFEQEAFQFWASQPVNVRQAHDEFYLQAVRIFHEEKVKLVAGTDAGIFTNLPGQSLARELELCVEAGLHPYDVLKMTTVNAADVLGEKARLGQVQQGFAADLVIIDGNPIERISDIRHVAGVIANGRWFDTDDLELMWKDAEHSSYERTRQRVLDGLNAQGSALEQ